MEKTQLSLQELTKEFVERVNIAENVVELIGLYNSLHYLLKIIEARIFKVGGKNDKQRT